MNKPEMIDGVKLLIADDDEPFRTSMATWLERNGCRATCASNAATALELLRIGEYDALISDINMPGNEGLQLIERLPGEVEGLPVILLTGEPTVETAARSVRLPVFAYLMKPPKLVELLALVQQCAVIRRQFLAVRASRQRLMDLSAELKQIQDRLGSGRVSTSEAPMAGFLRLTLCNIATSIVELERGTPLLGNRTEGGDDLKKLELIAAVRHCVEVLEKTRRSFKSKELGDLRHRLNELLRQPP